MRGVNANGTLNAQGTVSAHGTTITDVKSGKLHLDEPTQGTTDETCIQPANKNNYAQTSDLLRTFTPHRDL